MKFNEYASWGAGAFSAIFCTFVAASAWTPAQAGEPALRVESYYEGGDTFQCFLASEFSVAGLALGDPEEKIRTTLGEPKETRIGDGEDDGGGYTVYTYKYDGLSIDVVRGEVDSVEISSPSYATPSGLSVGLSKNDALAILGREPDPENQYEPMPEHRNEVWYAYWKKRHVGWYSFPTCPSETSQPIESYLEFKFGEKGRLEGLRFLAERP